MTGFEEARDLFFRYDDSLFHMSRDGVERKYIGMGVPSLIEDEWLVEMTKQYVTKLTDRGNWRSIRFFIDHRDYRHLEAIAGAGPRGVFWQKRAFLALVLDYIEESGGLYTAGRRIEVCDEVLHQAAAMRRRVSADRSIDELDSLEKRTGEVLEAIGE